MATNAEAGDDFDPASLPPVFTPELVRKMKMRDALRIEEHLDELTDEQRRTFQESVRATMGPSLDVAAKSFQLKLPRVPTAPKVPSPRLLESMQVLNERIERQKRWIERLSPDLVAPNASSVATPAVHEHNDLVFEDHVNLSDQATVEQVGRDLDTDSRLLGVMQAMLELMESDRKRTTAGAFFAFLVSGCVIVAGVAPLIEQDTWVSRYWTLGLSAGLIGLAGLVYYLLMRPPRAGIKPPNGAPHRSRGG